MTYKLTHEGYVIKGDMKIAITDSPELPNTNPHYLEYKAWLAAGNTPEPADPLPVKVPYSITRAQGKAILIIDGIWDDVLIAVDAIADPTQKALAEIAMHEQVTWLRDSPTLLMLAAALGLTEEQIDDMFIRAGRVEF